MNNDHHVSTAAVALRQPVTHLNPQPEPARVLKLALDVHLQEHVVAMKFDGGSPHLRASELNCLGKMWIEDRL